MRKAAHNSRFAKAGVSCFYDSEVLNSSFVHLMKFSAENPRLRKAAKRCIQCIFRTYAERFTPIFPFDIFKKTCRKFLRDK